MMGFKATVELASTSPYSCSRMHDTPKKGTKESPAAYDERTWREKCYFDADSKVLIPRMAFKFALMDAACYLGERVTGKGMRTWTQYFTSAVIVENDITLPILKEELESITLPCHANGNRKSGKRVPRTFPIIKSWQGSLCCLVLDETITREIFTRVWQHAGAFIGIGRFRPQNGGFNGRFVVKAVTWESLAKAA